MTLYLRGSETGEYFHDEIAKLLDIVRDTCPGKEKFVRVRGEEEWGEAWYLPLVKIDSRPSEMLLEEAKAEMLEKYK